MGFLSKLFASPVVDAVTGISNVVNQYVETPDEKRAAEILLQKIAMEPMKAQQEINKIEAGHRSIFIAGWRPMVGWVCSIGLAFVFIINPILQWLTGDPGPDLPTGDLYPLVLALLGLGTLRSAEKVAGRTK